MRFVGLRSILSRMEYEYGRFNEHELQCMSARDLIRSIGGWNEGHFVFRTGEHGNGYIDKMGFLRYPEIMEEIGRRLAKQFSDFSLNIDVVVGPSIIGAIIACSTASRLRIPYTVTYRGDRDQQIHFHRGFVPEARTRILFVDDFVFSGRDLTDNVAFMLNQGIYVVGASVIGQRHEIVLPVPIRSLLTLDFQRSLAEDCAMCHSGIPITAMNIRE